MAIVQMLLTFPDGEPMPILDDRPVARIRLTKDASLKPDPLFAQVLHRRSSKEAYSDKSLLDNAISTIETAAKHGSKVSVSNDIARVGRLRKIGIDAMKVEYVTPRTLGESIDLMRIGKAEIIANPDGISIGGPFF